MKILSELFVDFLNRIERRRELGGVEFSTSLDVIDNMTGGLERNGIMVIGGTPGSGKTSLALNMALKNAEFGHKVLFLSLEQDAISLVGRLFCNYCEVNNSALRTGEFYEKNIVDKVKEFKKHINGIDLQLVEKGYAFNEIVSIIEDGYKNKKPDIIFVDHIQLIKWAGFSSQNAAIMHYIRDLAELSKTHKTSLVLLSQINRKGIKSESIPTMYDLSGSGSIEQNADLVVLLYKEETEYESQTMTESYVSLEKNRLGEIKKSIPVIFKGQYYKFINPSVTPF